MGCIYVDFSICAPWDTRTNRSKKWKGLVVGADNKFHEEECKGPPDFACWTQCFKLWECMCIMAEVMLPPRITAYFKMAKSMADKHRGVYPYWYQQEDRFRHEVIPDIKRLQIRLYDEAITEFSTTNVWTPVRSEGSTFNPDDPWNHIMLLAVKSSDARHWWSEEFLWQAQQVVLGIKTLSFYLEGDAPIANSVAEHASTPYVPSQPTRAPRAKPVAPWEQKRPAPPPAQPGKPEKLTKDVTNKFGICNMYNAGKCTAVASGPCGPNSCAKRSQFIHACHLCGEAGHVASACPKQQQAAAPQGAGKKARRGGGSRGPSHRPLG